MQRKTENVQFNFYSALKPTRVDHSSLLFSQELSLNKQKLKWNTEIHFKTIGSDWILNFASTKKQNKRWVRAKVTALNLTKLDQRGKVFQIVGAAIAKPWWALDFSLDPGTSTKTWLADGSVLTGADAEKIP